MSTYTNTLSQYKISDDWNDHIFRNSRGGIDYAVKTGTPIPAPCNGTVENMPNNSGFGNYVRFHHDADTVGVGAGWRDEYLHLKDGGFVTPGHYNQGETIGFSGSTGQSTGPHIHHHLIRPDGVRVDPLLYVDGGSGVNAQAVNLQTLLNAHGYGLAVDGIVGAKTKAAIKDFQSKRGLLVDGIAGPKTMAALQAKATESAAAAGAKEVQTLLNVFGYGLVVDGDLGPASRAAIKDFQRQKGLAVDGVVGPITLAALRQGLPKPAPEKPAVAVKPVEQTKPVEVTKPIEPAQPVTPSKPSKPTPAPTPQPAKPAKEKEVKTIAPLPDSATSAGTDSLGILIPNPKARRLAYALYGLAALVISNLSVAVMASGTEAPVWLIVVSAIVGNLAVPFTTLAIANASSKK